MIAYTSRLALKEELPKLSACRARVYAAIAEAPEPGLCIAEIAVATRMKESSVCGRIDELRELGCIMDGPLKAAPITGKTVKTYIALEWKEGAPDPKQPELDLGETEEEREWREGMQ